MRSNRIDEALYGNKYRLTKVQDDALKDSIPGCLSCGSSENTFSSFVDHNKGQMVVRTSDKRCRAILTAVKGESGESDLDFVDSKGKVFQRMKMHVQYFENGYKIQYLNSYAQKIGMLEVNVTSMQVEYTPNVLPIPENPSIARDNWESRWSNCMRERIRNTINNPVDLGIFIGGGLIAPWVAMNSACAWEATFPSFAIN